MCKWPRSYLRCVDPCTIGGADEGAILNMYMLNYVDRN